MTEIDFAGVLIQPLLWVSQSLRQTLISNNCFLEICKRITSDPFLDFPLDQILNRGDAYQACKDLGQEIFDFYKGAANGNSADGGAALVAMYNTMRHHDANNPTERSRATTIALAWDGVGDDHYRWRI